MIWLYLVNRCTNFATQRRKKIREKVQQQQSCGSQLNIDKQPNCCKNNNKQTHGLIRKACLSEISAVHKIWMRPLERAQSIHKRRFVLFSRTEAAKSEWIEGLNSCDVASDFCVILQSENRLNMTNNVSFCLSFVWQSGCCCCYWKCIQPTVFWL